LTVEPKQELLLNRERFLTKKEEILLVLEMYCKNDYVGHFIRADKTEIEHS